MLMLFIIADITVPKKGIVVVVLVNGSCSKVNVDQWVE